MLLLPRIGALVRRSVPGKSSLPSRMVRSLCALILLIATACTEDTSVAEARHVRGVRDRFFAAISDYDSAAIRALSAADYVLVEDGAIWNLDSLNNAVMGLKNESLRIAYTFDDDSVRVEGPLAWMTYRNRGILSSERGADTLDWVESALFRKHAGAWRLVLLHSTRLREDE